MQRFVKIAFLVFYFVFSKQTFSQDIRSAWIDHKWISGYTYSITTTLIVDLTSSQTHTISTYFGDGDSCVSSTSTTSIGPIKVFKFSCTHTYDGPGLFKLYYIDKYRITGIKNLANSGTKSIYVESLLSIYAFMGPNNSAVVGINPINFSIPFGNLVYYNPSITDPDGDSLSYSLINSIGINPLGYNIPISANIDPYGVLSFHKDSVGIYVFGYFIKEWRKDSGGNWNLIGYKIMDFVLNNSSGVGIKEFDKKEIISLYPNPTSNILNIKSNSKTHSEIEITNQLGQTVLKQKFSESIDVSKLVPGCYFIHVDNSYSKFIRE